MQDTLLVLTARASGRRDRTWLWRPTPSSAPQWRAESSILNYGKENIQNVGSLPRYSLVVGWSSS